MDKEVITIEKGSKNILNLLNNELEWRDAEIRSLQAENAKLKDEAYKDQELTMMKFKLEQAQKALGRGFPLTESQTKAITEWRKNHDATEHANPQSYHGATGGDYTYSFYPTSIGTFGECTCNICERNARKNAVSHGRFDEKLYSEYMKEHDGCYEFDDMT